MPCPVSAMIKFNINVTFKKTFSPNVAYDVAYKHCCD